MTLQELSALLHETKAQTLQYFELNENELGKTYGEGKWNVRQILHHLTDTEYLFMGRLKKIIAEPKQVIWAFNPDDWNMAFNYEKESLEGKQELYAICRDMNCKIIERYYNDFGQKQFVHSQTGLRTLKEEFEKVGLHNEGHNKQIETALSR